MATRISDYFIGIAAKRLSNVEINSNQHEFNGINRFRIILGTERTQYSGTIIYLPDQEEGIVQNECAYTWYDVRVGNPNRSPEYRLYFSDNEVVPNAAIGDLVILAKNRNNELLIIVAPAESTSEKQLLWLFGLEEIENRFVVRDFRDDHHDIGFAGKYILESFGINVEERVDRYLEEMLSRFGRQFPTTREFSSFARGTVGDVSALDDPDNALMAWWDREGELLKLYEKELLSERLRQGFGEDGSDVDAFISFSLSVLNRRKSRAGHSLENHLETIFAEHRLSFTKGAKTERNNKPDFLFPSQAAYRNNAFPAQLLDMLGVKTTCKDRWRQVLPEANRINRKHLITLEPAISRSQTDEMIAQDLQLVIPTPIMNTYRQEQLAHIIDLSTLIANLKEKQQVFQ